jgi:hypothetical protein
MAKPTLFSISCGMLLKLVNELYVQLSNVAGQVGVKCIEVSHDPVFEKAFEAMRLLGLI